MTEIPGSRQVARHHYSAISSHFSVLVLNMVGVALVTAAEESDAQPLMHYLETSLRNSAYLHG